MKGNCVDIGAIQAFLDGETSPEVSAVISTHISKCDQCSLLLAEAEEENALVFSALDGEMNSMVPTQRLWASINETIERDASRRPFFTRLFDTITASFLSPTLSAAAGVIVLVMAAVVVWNLRSDDAISAGEIVAVKPPVASGTRTGTAVAPDVAALEENAVPEEKAEDAPVRPTLVRANVPRRTIPRNRVSSDPAVVNARYIPGEESYINTIADLDASVSASKDSVLPPASRIAYERDMALVNEGIRRLRDVVSKDPNNKAARQALYSAYQDKIDLLNSVGRRDELMASLQ